MYFQKRSSRAGSLDWDVSGTLGPGDDETVLDLDKIADLFWTGKKGEPSIPGQTLIKD